MASSIYDEDWESAPARREKRKWQRKPLIVAPNVKPPESPPQIAELAFNIHGWALEDVPTIHGREKFQKINAYTSTMQKGGFERKILDLRSQNIPDIYRTDLRFTARETEPDLPKFDPSVQEYLIVGYTLQEEDPVYQANPTFHRSSDNELIGESSPQSQYTIPWHSVRTPIYVVTPVKINTGTSVRLFALIMPRDGLCQPVLIAHERIFYRWEYRASAGKRSDQRNKNWNQIVIDKAYELMSPNMYPQINFEPSSKRKRPISARSPSIKHEDEALTNSSDQIFSPVSLSLELDLENLFSPMVSSCNSKDYSIPNIINTRIEVNMSSSDVRGILHQIRNSSNGRMTGELQATLRELELAQMTPSANVPGLSKLLSGEAVHFGDEDAIRAADEIKLLFPRLIRLAIPESIMRIKETMIEFELTLEYEHLEHYLTKLLVHLMIYRTSPVECVRDKFDEAKLEVHYLDNTMRLLSSSARVNVDTIFVVNLLKEILCIHDWQVSAVLDQTCANNPPPSSLKHCQLVHSFDIDLEWACKGYAEAAKWLIDAARRRSCDTDDIIIWLSRLLGHIQPQQH